MATISSRSGRRSSVTDHHVAEFEFHGTVAPVGVDAGDVRDVEADPRLLEFGKAGAHPETHRAPRCRPVRDDEVQVFAFAAHPVGPAGDGEPSRGENGLAVVLAEGLEPLDLPHHRRSQGGEARHGVDPDLSPEVIPRRRVPHGVVEGPPEVLEVLQSDREAGGGGVATEGLQVRGALREHLREMHRGHRAARTPAESAVECHEGDGAPELVGKAGRDDADDAGVPRGIREHEGAVVVRAVLGVHPRAGVGQDVSLDLAASAVLAIEGRRDFRAAGRVVREQKLQRQFRAAEATRRVEPRSEAEGDVRGCERTAADPGHLDERAQSGAERGREGLESEPGEKAVLSAEGDDVRHRAEGREPEGLGEERPMGIRDPAAAGHVPGHQPDDPEHHARRARGGSRDAREVGVHEGRDVGAAIARRVMVQDDDVEAFTARRGDLVDRGRSVVHRDDELRPLRGEEAEGRLVEAVPLAGPVGEVGARGGAGEPEEGDEYGRSGDAVGIVVTPDRDALAALHRLADPLRGRRRVGQESRVGQAGEVGLQERAGLRGVRNPPVQEHLGEDRGDTQFEREGPGPAGFGPGHQPQRLVSLFRHGRECTRGRPRGERIAGGFAARSRIIARAGIPGQTGERMADVVPIMVGTAGHVDHGKTTLLKRLLGGAPEADRLPEEQERGLTIDIGYAEMDLGDGRLVGFVDVPGHERFVRNMVAAASGIDLILLVVAADDGVMPQTKEHLDIAGLMGARSGFAVLTKIDLVDEELRLAAEEELRALLDASFLRGAPIVPVSAVTGEGLEDVRGRLAELIAGVEPRDASGVFRLPVQRSFSLPGHGTVVTGVPLAGRVRIGDLLEVVPGARPCRVRGIHAYHREVAEGRAGHRTALKLSDVSWRDVGRGDVVAEPGFLLPAHLIEARLTLLPRVTTALESNRPVRVHCGTDEVLGRVFLLSTSKLRPGETALVQLRLDRPLVAAPGDRFVVRLPSPQVTLGGGVVIGSSAGKVSATRARMVRRIAEREAGLGDAAAAVRSAIGARGLDAPTFGELAKELVRRREEIEEAVGSLVAGGEASVLGERVLAATQVAEGRRRIREALVRFHRTEPLRPAAQRAPLREKLGVSDAVLSFLISVEPEVESVEGGRLRLRSFAPALGEEQAARLAKIETILREARFATPRDVELPALVGGEPAEISRLLDLLRDRGEVVLLPGGVLFHRDSLAEARRAIGDFIGAHGRLMPADLKALFGMSRKYSIPLLEYLDQQRFTIRRGDERVMG